MIGKPLLAGYGPDSGNHDRASGNAIDFGMTMRSELPAGPAAEPAARAGGSTEKINMRKYVKVNNW